MTSIDSPTPDKGASMVSRWTRNAFLWRYPLLALCCGITVVTFTYLERVMAGSLPLAFVLFVLVVLVTIVVLLTGIVALFRARFKSAAALLLAPLILFSSFLFPIIDLQYRALDLIRFYYNKGRYAAVVDKLSPAERASRVVVFDWGGEGLAVTATSHYWLVYDESGEIALPDDERSQGWKDEAKKEKLYFTEDDCASETYHLSGHYYSVATVCPH